MSTSWNELAGFEYLQFDPEYETADVPLVICLHGRGADASDLAHLASDLPPGYRWIWPNAPHPVPFPDGSTGWAWYSMGPRAEPFAEEERAAAVIEIRDRLGDFVDQLLERLHARRDRTILMGFSQGASLCLHLGLAAPERFAAIISMSGFLPAPETLRGVGAGPPQSMLVIHGTYDRVLPISMARDTKQWLEGAGFSPRYVEISMDHQISYESLSVVREYLLEVLPPPAGQS